MPGIILASNCDAEQFKSQQSIPLKLFTPTSGESMKNHLISRCTPMWLDFMHCSLWVASSFLSKPLPLLLPPSSASSQWQHRYFTPPFLADGHSNCAGASCWQLGEKPTRLDTRVLSCEKCPPVRTEINWKQKLYTTHCILPKKTGYPFGQNGQSVVGGKVPGMEGGISVTDFPFSLWPPWLSSLS